MASFAPSAAQGGNFGFSSSRIAVPGAGTVLRVANLGPNHIAVKLGDNTVTVTQSTGTVILAGQTEYFTVGSNTNIAGVSAGGPGNTSTVNLASGTLT
jgi:hypothetical protein